MLLQGCRFEVSWPTQKAAVVRRKGIEIRDAIRLRDDPCVRLEYQREPPYAGQERAIGCAPDGRLLTIAIEITYPNDAENAEDIGLLQVHTAWEASTAERAAYNDEQ